MLSKKKLKPLSPEERQSQHPAAAEFFKPVFATRQGGEAVLAFALHAHSVRWALSPFWVHPLGKADMAAGAGREEVNHRTRQKRPLGKRCCCLMSGCFSVELSWSLAELRGPSVVPMALKCTGWFSGEEGFLIREVPFTLFSFPFLSFFFFKHVADQSGAREARKSRILMDQLCKTCQQTSPSSQCVS